MAEARAPRVSIGLPVFDGERYLERAAESLLAQTYQDFELIVVDNASSDGTEAIGRALAARDPRVRYVRNETNIGAAPNFNRAFELSRGEYFKWAAHDDLCAPELIERCVSALDTDPDVVLAYPRTRIIDADDEPKEDYPSIEGVQSDDPVERFRTLVGMGHKRFEIFGLIRREALRRAGPMGSYASGDCVLVVRLALQGRFTELPEFLLLAREHPEQSMQMVLDFYAYTVWFDPRRRGKLIFPRFRVLGEHLRSIARSRLGLGRRLRCLRTMIDWVWNARFWLRGELKTGALHLLGRDPRAAGRGAP